MPPLGSRARATAWIQGGGGSDYAEEIAEAAATTVRADHRDGQRRTYCRVAVAAARRASRVRCIRHRPLSTLQGLGHQAHASLHSPGFGASGTGLSPLSRVRGIRHMPLSTLQGSGHQA
eukprot:353728-Chlamydomonas_euryale.AAC.3